MEQLTESVMGDAAVTAAQDVLAHSLGTSDFWCAAARAELESRGSTTDEAVGLLARHRSLAKYGYEISARTVTHVQSLFHGVDGDCDFTRLVRAPFFLAKACWLYDHSPFFLFYDKTDDVHRDGLVLEFAKHYDTNYLSGTLSAETWEPVRDPRRVMLTTFWESRHTDPVALIDMARQGGYCGLELSIDFHPFNYTRLLPEEIDSDNRARIRHALKRAGVKLDLHSPIIGPYVPSPNPSHGKQIFFDPANCMPVQFDVIDLAKDVGAECVVFHLISTENPLSMVPLVERAAGSDVRVSIENYCQIGRKQGAKQFVDCLEDIWQHLAPECRKRNLAVTLDVGHFNIEGDDPVVAADRVGRWCVERGVKLRIHATDNYGNLLFSPPAYSADVHSNVSGRGINNAVVIKLLRSMGLEFDVVAEQLHPPTPEDVALIHDSQIGELPGTYESIAATGDRLLAGCDTDSLVSASVKEEAAYRFLVGIQGPEALREHLFYRRIQTRRNLSVDEAKSISQAFMRMPQTLKVNLTTYIDDLLMPIQSETGAVQKSDMDLICQNVSGALFGAISNEYMASIFEREIRVGTGQMICRQGQSGQEMYYIKNGGAHVFIDGVFMAALAPGQIFGELSLFYNTRRSATVVSATEETVVGTLTRDGLETLFRTGKPYAHGLIYRLFSILPERLRALTDKYKTVLRTLQLLFDDVESPAAAMEDAQLEIEEEHARFFAPLSDGETLNLSQEERRFETGETVLTEGALGDGAYIILEGTVDVVSSLGHAKPVKLAELGPGEIFGEMALIDDRPRCASVITASDCRMVFVDKQAFNSLIETGSDLAFRLMGFICLCLFRRILRLDRIYSEVKRVLESK